MLDLHSGGRTLQFLPFCGMHVLDDAAQMAPTRAAMLAFGAPFSVIIDEFDRLGMLDTAVEQLGKVFLFTELGGGGAATAATVAIAERGIQNLLRHLGMIEGAPENVATRLLHSPDASYFVVSEDRGIFEIWSIRSRGCGRSADRPGARRRARRVRPLYRAERSGLLIGRRWPGPTRPGDCLAVIATDAPAR